MKVFNWVHRKFLHVHIQSNSNFIQEDEKRSSSFEKHALLDDDQHNTWGKDEILAIGTLGIGPFDANNNNNMQFNSSADQILQEDILFPHDDHDDHDHDGNNDNDHDHDDHVMVTHKELVKVETCHEIEEVVDLIQMTSENHESEKKASRKRVTLADLFSEDSDHHHHHHHHDGVHGTKYTLKQVLQKDDDESLHDNGSISNNSIATEENPSKSGKKKKKPSPSRAKNGFKKAKKIFKDDFRPVDIFNQLMRRMIKKKIHPDVQEKMQKDIQMQPEVGPHQPSSLFLV